MPSFGRRFLAALLVLAAPARAKVLEDTIASVNGQPVLLSEYRKNLGSVFEQYRQNLPKVFEDEDAVRQIRQKVLDQMVDDELLAQHAEKSNVKATEREIDNGVEEVKARFKTDDSGKPVPEEEADRLFREELKREGLDMAAFRKRLRKQVRVRKVIEESVRPQAKPPTEEDARGYFDKMQVVIKGDTTPVAGMSPMEAQQLTLLAGRLKDAGAERIRARHILIKVPPGATLVDKSRAMKTVESMRKRLKDGEDFSELARKHSEDTESAKRGGDLGFFLKGWMVPEFDKVAFSLPVGEVSDAVETQFGYHLIRVEEKKAAHKPSFEEVQDQLSQALFSMRVQKELEKLVLDLRAKGTLEVHTPVEKVSLK